MARAWINNWKAGVFRGGVGINLIVLGSTLAGGVGAQERTSTATLPARDARTFNIPPQPLASALTSLGRQAGLQITFDASVVSAMRSSGVSGALTPAAALARVIGNNHVAYHFANSRTVVLQREVAVSGGGGAAVPGEVALDVIDVNGAVSNSLVSPPGYVATRSTTGTKTDTPLIETPQSISVVTRDQMNDQAVQSVAQALRYTSGLVAETYGSQNMEDFLQLRGFQPDQYLDGLKLLGGEFGASQIDPHFLDRIDVLHGPSSVLYGQGSPGGTVSMTSKLPMETPFHELELFGGSYGRIQGAFDFGGPIDPDGHFLYRLTGIGYTGGTQIDFLKEQRVGIAPSLTWKPDGDTSLTVLARYQNDPGGRYYNWVPSLGTVKSNPNGSISTNLFVGDPNYHDYHREEYMIGYLFDHRFDETLSIHQGFRYTHLDADYKTLFTYGLEDNLRTLDRYAYHNDDSINAITLDNHALAKFDTGPFHHTTILGVDYQHQTFDQEGGFNFSVPSLDIFSPQYYQSIPLPPDAPDDAYNLFQTADQIGVYAQDQIKFDHLSLLLGGREDWADSGVYDRLLQSDTTQSNRHFSGRAGAVYLFDFGLAPYFSFSQSFQPVTGTTAPQRGSEAFKPKTGEQYEAGVKYQPPGMDSFVTASVFQLTQQNVATSDPIYPQYQVQQGEIRSRGFEFEAHANPTREFGLIASYSYLANIVTKDNQNRAGVTVLGKHPVGIPQQSASVWAIYNFLKDEFDGLSLGAGVRYTGISYGNSQNTFTVPSYTLFDAKISYDLGSLLPELKGVKIQVNASNIFDKKFVSYCNGDAFCTFGLRRTVYATLKYNW